MMKQTKLLFFVHHLYAVDGKKQIALTEGDDLLSVDDAVRPLTHRLKAAVATYTGTYLVCFGRFSNGSSVQSVNPTVLKEHLHPPCEIQIYAKNRR